jgi:putative transposase
MPRRPSPPNPFRWFDSSPEVIRLVVMMYVRYPLSLRNVEDLLFERGIDICHEGVDNLTAAGSRAPLPFPDFRRLGWRPPMPGELGPAKCEGRVGRSGEAAG